MNVIKKMRSLYKMELKIERQEIEIERLRRALKTIQSINPSAAHAAFLMRDAALVALKEDK